MRLKLYRGRYYAVWYDDGTKRHALNTADKPEAERRLADFIAHQQGKLTTAGEIWHAYVREKAHTSHSKNLMYAWKFLGPHFEHLRPDQITRENTKRYTILRLKTGIKPSTVLRELGRLKAACRWHDPKTPAVFEMPPSGKPRETSITKAECRQLIDSADAPHVKLFIIIASQTGGRMSAILELTWPQIDFERSLVSLSNGDQAGKKGRATVRMSGLLREALQEAYRARTCDWVVEYGGRRVASVRTAFKTASLKAGLRISPHVLRHSAAVWMAEAGYPMSQIAQVLGHADSRITERYYARYSPAFMANIVEALAI